MHDDCSPHLVKMLLVGIWHGGLSDESIEDMANSNLHVMRFLGLMRALQLAVETTAANCHDNKMLLSLLDKTSIQSGTLVHADKATIATQQTDHKSSLCRRTHLWKPSTLVWQQNTVLPWEIKSACLAYSASSDLQLKKATKNSLTIAADDTNIAILRLSSE